MVMVRYKVKVDRAAENERYIQAVFAELERDRPTGIHYASFKQEDGVSFVHVAAVDTEDGTNPLSLLAAFKEFTASVKDRCAEPPVTSELSAVGAYRFWGS
jgi:hypothetical protein